MFRNAVIDGEDEATQQPLTSQARLLDSFPRNRVEALPSRSPIPARCAGGHPAVVLVDSRFRTHRTQRRGAPIRAGPDELVSSRDGRRNV